MHQISRTVPLPPRKLPYLTTTPMPNGTTPLGCFINRCGGAIRCLKQPDKECRLRSQTHMSSPQASENRNGPVNRLVGPAGPATRGTGAVVDGGTWDLDLDLDTTHTPSTPLGRRGARLGPPSDLSVTGRPWLRVALVSSTLQNHDTGRKPRQDKRRGKTRSVELDPGRDRSWRWRTRATA